MAADGVTPATLRIDGGMVTNDWLVQFLADILSLPVDRPRIRETTALGAACLAGRKADIYGSFDDFTKIWQADARFEPQMSKAETEKLIAGWQDAVQRVLADQ